MHSQLDTCTVRYGIGHAHVMYSHPLTRAPSLSLPPRVSRNAQCTSPAAVSDLSYVNERAGEPLQVHKCVPSACGAGLTEEHG